MVREKLRKDISTHTSSIPIVQEDTSQVDDISLIEEMRGLLILVQMMSQSLVQNLHSMLQ